MNKLSAALFGVIIVLSFLVVKVTVMYMDVYPPDPIIVDCGEQTKLLNKMILDDYKNDVRYREGAWYK